MSRGHRVVIIGEGQPRLEVLLWSRPTGLLAVNARQLSNR